ncbi:hypothetical protein TWF506_004869 [Arthrobotrys conoides]|uniref:DUF6598 domain-containing protein n=1 Tax=Arthrobotrys conoides TaxID=74498 RepID=A0AAN8NV38_9PEZI
MQDTSDENQIQGPMHRQLALILDGRPLVEIYYLQILNIHHEYLGELFGNIIASDGLSKYTVFSRSRGDSESIKPGYNVTLTGPRRVISAAGEVLITFDLWDKDSTRSSDDQVVHDWFSWNAHDHTNVYNTFKTAKLVGRYGAANLNYIVMDDAVEALVIPIGKDLTIGAILWDANLSSDDEILFGSTNFTAKPLTSASAFIEGAVRQDPNKS